MHTATGQAEARKTSGSPAESAAPSDEDGAAEEQESADEPPALAEYIRRADRICKSAQLAIAKRSADYRELARTPARGNAQRRRYFRRGGDLAMQSGEIAQRAVADLRVLPRPTARREAIEAYLNGATTQAAVLTEQGEVLRQGPSARLAQLNRRAAQATQRARAAAQRVGFRVCGGG